MRGGIPIPPWGKSAALAFQRSMFPTRRAFFGWRAHREPPMVQRVSDPLPFAIPLAAPIVGQLKARPEDFVVEELPAYEPSGEGEHLYLRIEKRGVTTPAASERIARALGVDRREAGWAGLKDRHAITRQWLSFARGDAEKAAALDLEGISVLEVTRHKNKLKTGHVRGNRFELLLRGADPTRIDDAKQVLEALSAKGVPNYFGEQRFGASGDNVARARAWIVEGGRAPSDRFDRKMLVSALQSAGFNNLLAKRVAAGELDSIVEGDLCRKEPTGGMFVSTELEVDRARAAAFEISATGPMFGSEMRWPEGEAKAREQAEMASMGLTEENMARFRKAGEGTRRAYRVPLAEASVAAHDDGLRLCFTLPSGAYATIVARELHRDAAT